MVSAVPDFFSDSPPHGTPVNLTPAAVTPAGSMASFFSAASSSSALMQREDSVVQARFVTTLLTEIEWAGKVVSGTAMKVCNHRRL